MIGDFPLLLYREKVTQIPSGQNLLPLVNNSKAEMTKPSLVEKVLICQLKAGYHLTFSQIFSAYYSDLVMFATRFTHDLNFAEEIVQDTFVRLWEDHESIIVSISLRSYLLKMVQNRCIDWCRHKKIMQTHNSFVLENSPQFDYDTDNYILYSELQEQIEIALGMLPDSISEVFRMNRYKGLKYHEIADIMDVSVRTIEVRIGKALQILRTHLKGYFVTIIGTIISILF